MFKPKTTYNETTIKSFCFSRMVDNKWHSLLGNFSCSSFFLSGCPLIICSPDCCQWRLYIHKIDRINVIRCLIHWFAFFHFYFLSRTLFWMIIVTKWTSEPCRINIVFLRYFFSHPFCFWPLEWFYVAELVKWNLCYLKQLAEITHCLLIYRLS